MVYLSQYTIVIGSSFRLTYRKYFYWLLRNSSYLLGNFFYASRLRSGGDFSTIRQYSTHPEFLQDVFVDSISRHYSTRSPYWRPLLEVQYVRSLEYWSYNLNLNRVKTKKILPSKPITFSKKLFFNQTILEFKYTGLSTDQTVFKKLFTDIVQLILNNWQLLRPTNFIDLKFMLFSVNCFLFKKFNTKFFKIYSI
jgi:hypothetical protein